MALQQSALLGLVESLSTADEGTLMRRLLGTMLQLLVDAEAEAVIGAGRYERSTARTTQRNGSRAKVVATTSGDVEVAIGEASRRFVLPVIAGASAAYRRRLARGDHGGVRAWCVDS